MTTIERATAALKAVAFNFQDEAELQEGIAFALTLGGLTFKREAKLSDQDRIDFLLEAGVGIEVKVGGSISALTRQVFRYTVLEQLSAVIVVVSKSTLGNLPREMNGKQVHVVNVGRAFA